MSNHGNKEDNISSVIGSMLNYIDDNDYNLLSKEEEIDLIDKAQNGSLDARDELIYSNMKLVVSCASKYSGNFLTIDDLVQEGYFGLVDAIDKFDTKLGYRFSTYATWWIKQRMTRSISNKDRTVRIPVYLIENMSKVAKAEEDLYDMGVKNPTIKDIADFTGINEVNVERAYKNKDIAISIDTKITGKDDNELTLEDFIEDQESPHADPYQVASQNLCRLEVEEALSDILDNREKAIVKLRFGLNESNRPYELSEISQLMSLSKERVRQIEKEALEKLRNSKSVEKLASYLF